MNERGLIGTNVNKINMAEFRELYAARCAATPKYSHNKRIIFKHFLVILVITITNLTTTYSYWFECFSDCNNYHNIFDNINI